MRLEDWLAFVVLSTGANMGRDDAEARTRLTVYRAILQRECDPRAFTEASATAVAAQIERGLPPAGWLAQRVNDWWRSNRPQPPALPPPPPPPPRTPPTPAEAAAVAEIVRAMRHYANTVTQQRHEQLNARRVVPPRTPRTLTDAELDAAYRAAGIPNPRTRQPVATTHNTRHDDNPNPEP